MAPIIKSVFGGGGGVANLAYTASPTQGTVTSDTGTDAIIPAADGTNAGLFLPAEKTKLAGIAEGAEVNVNADWNASSGDAQILNKPTLGTAAATNSTDYATAAQGAKADTAVQPAAIGSTVLAFDSNLQSFVNAFTLPTTDGTAGQSLVTNGAGVISFATPAILADPVYIGGVAYFNRSTKPTERSAGLPLVIGDRWYKTDDGTEWFWNGTYWLGLSPIIRSGYGSLSYSGDFSGFFTTNDIIMSPRRSSAYVLFLESADYLVKVTTADSLNYWDVKWRNVVFDTVSAGGSFYGSTFPSDPGFTVNSPTDTYNKQVINVLFSHATLPVVSVQPSVIKTGSPSNIFMSYNMILREVFP